MELRQLLTDRVRQKHYIRQAVSRIWSVYRFVTLFSIGMILLFPLMYMISVSLRYASDLSDPMVVWIPTTVTFKNFADTFKLMNYPIAFLTSLKLSLIPSLLTIFSCSLTGYGFSRFKFKGRNALFLLVLLMLIVPPQNTLISMFLQYREFDLFGLGQIMRIFTGKPFYINLSGTDMAMFLPAALASGIRAGLYILIFNKFFTNIPTELEDAAAIDGCGVYKTFFKVILPNARAALLTVFLFSIVWYWNDYFYTSVFMQNTSSVTMQLTKLNGILKQALNPLHTSTAVLDPNEITVRLQAGCLLALAPLIAMYTFLQRYFTDAIERTGIVG